MKGTLDLRPAIKHWWAQEGWGGWIAYVAVPAAVGAAIILTGRHIGDLGPLQTGMFFIAGFQLNLMFRMLDWTRESTAKLIDARVGGAEDIGAAERGRHHDRLELIESTYGAVSWSGMVSLALAAIAVIAQTSNNGATIDNSVASAALAAVMVHVVIVLLGVINRVFIVLRDDMARERDRIRE
jgi:hypothetical protein